MGKIANYLARKAAPVLLGALNGELRASIENPNVPISSDKILEFLGLERATASGAVITTKAAMRISTVFACVRVLSEGVGMLPFGVFERISEKEIQPRGDHPVDKVLKKPNESQIAINFRGALTSHAALLGDGFALIERDRAERVRSLFPLDPALVQPERRAGMLSYRVTASDGQMRDLDPAEIIHITGPTWDGTKGMSVVAAAREAFGLAIETERFGARFFSNDARPSVVFEIPGALTEPAQQKVRDDIEARQKGQGWSFMVAEDGLKVHTVSIPNEDSQFLETRNFQVVDIARIFRVPPHLVGHLEQATFNNIEELGIGFVTYSLAPWIVRWEQEINTKLLSRPGPKLFSKMNFNALLRGNHQTRGAFYHQMFMDGVMSPNDIRELEDMNPVAGGDVHYVPANMLPLGAARPPTKESQSDE